MNGRLASWMTDKDKEVFLSGFGRKRRGWGVTELYE